MKNPNAEIVGLHNCANEPIRIPGKIQPHGVLIAISRGDLVIRHVSTNSKMYLRAEAKELVGKKLDAIFESEDLRVLANHLQSPSPEALNPSKIRSNGKNLDVIVHVSGDLLLVEFEQSSSNDEISFTDIYRRIHRTIEHINEANSQQEMFNLTAEDVRALTRYDRVMIYKFDAEWNGKVIAEAVAPGTESFMGLQYPASDIPAQARALYQTNWLRIIPDVHYQPVAIFPELRSDQSSIDLSASVLRSVSPIHLQYLKNMGVGASMSISIVRDGILWGLIACHANQARYLSYEVRQGLEFIGKFFSAQLGAKEKVENRDYKAKLSTVQMALHKKMRDSYHFLEGLYRDNPTLLDLIEGCSGAAIYFSGQKRLIGTTPSQDQIEVIVRWLRENKNDHPIFCTTELSKSLPEADEYSKIASGILAIEIPEPESAYVIWFKPEVRQTVSWSGNPEKPMEQTSEGVVLSPRRSFELWEENVKNRSLPWPAEEIAIAETLRRSIIEIDLARQVAATKKSNQELDEFAHLVAHDLKEPLRNIQFFSEFISQDASSQLDPESKRNLSDIHSLAEWAKTFVTELYEYSRLGKVELSFSKTNLDEVVREVVQRYSGPIQDQRIEIKIPKTLPTMECDRVRISEVFANLISNAIKYNDSERKWIEIGFDDTKKPTAFYVRDNGIGIAAKDFSRLFKVFVRLHERDQYGGGTGSGLALSKKIIERHSGLIWIESTVGKGTTFWFTLQPTTSE